LPVDLTKVRARLNNVKRKLYYKNPSPLKLLNVNEVLYELKKDWHMPTTVTSNLAVGAEYWDLYIADSPDKVDLEMILTLTTQVEINGERYKILQYTRPRGVTKQWNLRLESTGERKNFE